MLPLVTIIATIIFFALWRSGFLEELSQWSKKAQADRLKQPDETNGDPEMAKRLEVFEEFIDELPDDDLE